MATANQPDDALADGDDDAESVAIDQVPFGQALVAKGLASKEAVHDGVQLQAQLAGRGVFLRLGEVLVARGVIDEATVAEVLALQGTKILFCESCTAQYNVLIYQRALRYRCSRCQHPLTQPDQLSGISVEDTLVHSDLELDPVDLGAGRDFGNYVIMGEIDRGGMAIVYKARQRDLDRVVAMKIMTRPEGEVTETENQFVREARSVARLRHPNIVAIHEVGQLSGVNYYTMDYIEGVQLERAVTAEGLDEREIVEVFVKLCDAVDYANTEGVLHRDLKPQNVLLDQKHNPILLDFGIARNVGEGELDDTKIVGSPAYLPPEYVADGVYDVPGEVYALGATLYSVLAGRPPHTGIDTIQMLRRAKVDKVTPLRSLRRSVNADLASIVMTSLDRDLGRRYSTVHDMGTDLRRWLEGDEIAGSQTPMQRAWTKVRGKVAAVVGLILAFVLITVSGSATLAISQQREAGKGTASQHEREREALKEQVFQLRFEKAALMLDANRAHEADTLLTQLLKRDTLRAAELYALRAKARALLGNEEGAKLDREAAARLERR